MPAHELPRHIVFQVAVEADCDPRTVEKVVLGKPVRPRAASRVRKALTRMGLPFDEPAVAVESKKSA